MLEAVVSEQSRIPKVCEYSPVMQSEGVVRAFIGPQDVGSWLVS